MVEPVSEKLDLSGLKEKGYMKLEGKANINTDDARVIMGKTGMGKDLSYAITGGRKIYGKYTRLEDLLALKKWKPIHIEKYGHLLEV